MKNNGNIIYVGKARNLKKRVNSYFNRVHTGKTKKLVSEIEDFEYIVVSTEKESLILENNLIKKYDPKYNILLRDDKTYPYIELTHEVVPRLKIVRNINLKKDKTSLYGPYPNVTAARETVNLLNRIYPLRKCNTFEKKPCLYYHLNQCLGYCSNNVDKDRIKEMIKEITSFLKGNDEIVINKLKQEMIESSNKLNFERAKYLKDLLDNIDITISKQKVEINETYDIDVFGYFYEAGYLSVQVLFIRGSKIIGRHSKIIPVIQEYNEEFNNYLVRFYDKDVIKPKEILTVPIVENLNDYLGINIIVPLKGNKKKIVDMANLNAKIKLEESFKLIERDLKRTELANEELKNILKLNKLYRIDIFDNSNLFGTYNVSGMVVFKNGIPSKNDYRKFKIMLDKNDDYNTMKEVIARRYTKVLNEKLESPDLIIVDGGKNQINACLEVLNDLNVTINVAGLKKDNKHNTNALIFNNEEIIIDKHSDLFNYLERMQNEVHNFTINYHKKIRSKGSLSSILDNVEGIGTKRKNELLKKYKNIENMKKSSIEELNKILPNKVSINLLDFLNNI